MKTSHKRRAAPALALALVFAAAAAPAPAQDALDAAVSPVVESYWFNYGMWRGELDSLQLRMGELRRATGPEPGFWARARSGRSGRNGDARYTSASNAAEGGTTGNDSGNGNTDNNGSSSTASSTYDGPVSFGYSADRGTLELGYDRKLDFSGTGGVRLVMYNGGTFSYTRADGLLSSGGTGGHNTFALSYYNTSIINEAHHLDFALKGGFYMTDFKGADTGKYTQFGILGSLEYGYNAGLPRGWFAEPEAQLYLGYFDDVSYKTGNRVSVRVDDTFSVITRVGFRLGKKFGEGGLVYAKANLFHDFTGDWDISMTDTSEGNQGDDWRVTGYLHDTWFEYGLGLALDISGEGAARYIYCDISRSEGSTYYESWKLNCGLRIEM